IPGQLIQQPRVRRYSSCVNGIVAACLFAVHPLPPHHHSSTPSTPSAPSCAWVIALLTARYW
ncbi:hypothetical protein J6590_007096, partial [Homalodisca vitripennis]